MITTIPNQAIDLILTSEGLDQPWRWPGGGSGITLGYGCDIGADPTSLEFWRGILTDRDMESLKQARGKTGRRAAEIRTRFRDISVTAEQARKVFIERSLPAEIHRTVKAFAGVELMPPAVIGAMVSLVYNRGTSTVDAVGSNRRREMRIIKEILADYQTLSEADRKTCLVEIVAKIATQIRRMKRLWEGKGLDGLLIRRDAEADLCLSAI